MTSRIILDILLLLSVFLMPFWFTALFAFVLLFYFENFYEIIPLFFLADLLYGVPESRFLGITAILLITAIIVYFLSFVLKKRLKFYRI